MEKVRCKFECQDVRVSKGWSEKNPFTYSYELRAVYDDKSPENKAYWEATPSGSFKMDCVGPKDLFIPGKFYYLDITPCEDLKKIEA